MAKVVENAEDVKVAEAAQIAELKGGWSAWSDYGDCSVTCGIGSKTRIRTCISPISPNGGSACIGEDSETMGCEDIACPGIYSCITAYITKMHLIKLAIHLIFTKCSYLSISVEVL